MSPCHKTFLVSTSASRGKTPNKVVLRKVTARRAHRLIAATHPGFADKALAFWLSSVNWPVICNVGLTLYAYFNFAINIGFSFGIEIVNPVDASVCKMSWL